MFSVVFLVGDAFGFLGASVLEVFFPILRYNVTAMAIPMGVFSSSSDVGVFAIFRIRATVVVPKVVDTVFPKTSVISYYFRWFSYPPFSHFSGLGGTTGLRAYIGLHRMVPDADEHARRLAKR